MYCPNCGSQTSSDQKFCRACGLGLEKIALSLSEQLPTRPDEKLVSEKERFERLGVAALSVFGAGVVGLLLFFIVYRMMFLQGKILNGLALFGLAIMAACGVLATILFAKAKEVEEAAGKRRVQTTNAKPTVEATTTNELLTEGRFEPVPSVTDRTTELLYAEKKDAQGR
jgi:hypothetical protein